MIPSSFCNFSPVAPSLHPLSGFSMGASTLVPTIAAEYLIANPRSGLVGINSISYSASNPSTTFPNQGLASLWRSCLLARPPVPWISVSSSLFT